MIGKKSVEFSDYTIYFFNVPGNAVAFFRNIFKGDFKFKLSFQNVLYKDTFTDHSFK